MINYFQPKHDPLRLYINKLYDVLGEEFVQTHKTAGLHSEQFLLWADKMCYEERDIEEAALIIKRAFMIYFKPE